MLDIYRDEPEIRPSEAAGGKAFPARWGPFHFLESGDFLSPVGSIAVVQPQDIGQPTVEILIPPQLPVPLPEFGRVVAQNRATVH